MIPDTATLRSQALDADCRIGTAPAGATRPDTFSFREMPLQHEFTMGVSVRLGYTAPFGTPCTDPTGRPRDTRRYTRDQVLGLIARLLMPSAGPSGTTSGGTLSYMAAGVRQFSPPVLPLTGI